MAITHALLQTSTLEIIEKVDATKRFRSGTPPTLKPEKDLHWVPYIVEDTPSFDPLTQIQENPVETITKHEIRLSTRVRQINAEERNNRDSDNDKYFIANSSSAEAVWILIELISGLLDKEIINEADFSPKVKKAYENIKKRVDRAKV
tara:strand:- start:219 stop:662 length:444 start_codon:yes stop_codon:yes gene_type:complete